jgi:hypothetical protein
MNEELYTDGGAQTEFAPLAFNLGTTIVENFALRGADNFFQHPPTQPPTD